MWTRPVSRIALPRTLTLGLALAGLALSTPSTGQDLEEILIKHYEARGGLDAIKALDGVHAIGKVEIPGMGEAGLQFRVERPSRFRLDLDLGPMGASIEAYDGVQAWAQRPGEAKPAVVEGAAAEQIIRQADLDGTLVDYALKGHELELLGKEKVEKGRVWRLRYKERGGTSGTLDLDTKSLLIVRRTIDGPDGDDAVVMTLSDHREVAGVQLHHRQETQSAQGDVVVKIDRYETGVDFDQALFSMPGQEADSALELTQILERHRDVRWPAGSEQVQTVEAKGQVTLQGFTLPMTMRFLRPDAFRVDIDMQGMSTVLAFDGSEGWTVSPLQGIVEPEALPEEAYEAVAVFSDVLWGLLHDSLGQEVSLAGVEAVGRDQTYALDVSRAGGTARKVHLGGEDFLERQLSFAGVFLGFEGELDVLLSEYETLSGLVIPRRIEVQVNGSSAGELLVEEISTGVELDAAAFERPPATPEG